MTDYKLKPPILKEELRKDQKSSINTYGNRKSLRQRLVDAYWNKKGLYKGQSTRS